MDWKLQTGVTYYAEHSQTAASAFRQKYFIRIKVEIITIVTQLLLLVLLHHKKRNLKLTWNW